MCHADLCARLVALRYTLSRPGGFDRLARIARENVPPGETSRSAAHLSPVEIDEDRGRGIRGRVKVSCVAKVATGVSVYAPGVGRLRVKVETPTFLIEDVTQAGLGRAGERGAAFVEYSQKQGVAARYPAADCAADIA